jgi:hypothetical protein
MGPREPRGPCANQYCRKSFVGGTGLKAGQFAKSTINQNKCLRVGQSIRKPLLYPAELRGRKAFLAYPQTVCNSCL